MEDYGIIAHSPTVPAGNSALAHRIVIRDQGAQFVVHMQVFESNGAVSFNHGNYFQKRDVADSTATSGREALAEAWVAFDRRSRRILGIPEAT